MRNITIRPSWTQWTLKLFQKALVEQDTLISHQVSEVWSTLQSLLSSVVGLLGQERTAPPVHSPALSASSRACFSAPRTSFFCLTFRGVFHQARVPSPGPGREPVAKLLSLRRRSVSVYSIQFHVLDTDKGWNDAVLWGVYIKWLSGSSRQDT